MSRSIQVLVPALLQRLLQYLPVAKGRNFSTLSTLRYHIPGTWMVRGRHMILALVVFDDQPGLTYFLRARRWDRDEYNAGMDWTLDLSAWLCPEAALVSRANLYEWMKLGYRPSKLFHMGPDQGTWTGKAPLAVEEAP